MPLPRRRIYDIGLFAALLVLAAVIVRGWMRENDNPQMPQSRPMKRERVEPTEDIKGRNTNDPIDLLKMLDPQVDAVAGSWAFDGAQLISSTVAWGRLEIPCIPPTEYDLKVVVTKEKGTDSLNMGLSNGKRQFMVVLDGNGGKQSGLDLVKGKGFSENVTTFTEKVFDLDKTRTVVYYVRQWGLEVALDGVKVIDWHGDFEDIPGVLPPWFVRHKQALFIGCFDTCFRIQEMTLTPISGSCTLLR